MVRLLLVLLTMLANLAVTAQVRMDFEPRLDTVVVPRYELQQEDAFSLTKQVFLRMDMGEYSILNPGVAKSLRSETISKIELLYTDYPRGADLNELNRARLIELFIHLPEAFNRNVIEWKLVKQTGAWSADQAAKMPHGIVVTIRPVPGYDAESRTIQAILEGKHPVDSTFMRVFERHPGWKNQVVVCDATGSMSPYLGSLLLWLKLNNVNKLGTEFVFFNDDDMLSNKQDKMLDTNGIKAIATNRFDPVMHTLLTAMQKNGHVENDLEALFYAARRFVKGKGREGIILIADNWEDPCDLNLLSSLREIGVPVHVVMCGVSQTINLNYFDIAMATGGSVHTMEADLEALATISEGKVIRFGKWKLKMQKGKFVQIR